MNASGSNKLPLSGKFSVEHWRNGELLGTHEFSNDITNEGKNILLNVMFHGVTQITQWYFGLINNSGYTALAAADTYDNIDQAGNGWDEFASYTDTNNAESATTRPAWQEDAAASQSIANTTVSIFTITGTGQVKGIFVVGGTDSQTKSDHTAGTYLWSTALFATGDVAVQATDVVKVVYTVSA
jgi:hypothetical protein